MPACSGAPDVMGIHNTHTYLHPPHPWTLETHTQSVEHQSSGPDGSSMCRQRWELLGYRRHLLHRWRRWWRSERMWVCESVNHATLQRWFTTWMRLWQRCKVTVSFIIKSGVARRTPAAASFIYPHRFLLPWADTDIIPPIIHSPALSFTLLDCATLSVNICLWRFCWCWEGQTANGVPTGMGNHEIYEKCEV